MRITRALRRAADENFTRSRIGCANHLFLSLPLNCLTISGFFFCLAVLSPIEASAIEMNAGTARTVITPDKHDGKINDIFARVLTLHDGSSRLVIVTYDLHSLEMATAILRKRCSRELGIDPSRLLLIATHSHQAPLGRLPENFPYQKWLANRIFAAIKEAIAKEQGPVRVFFGWGHGYFVRASGNAPTDYEIQLLRVMQEEQVVAMLFNQPTHLIRSSRSRKIGTEHPGYAMDEVERKLPGALAMYGDACGGNQWQTIPKAGTDNLTLWYDMNPEGRLSRTLPGKYSERLEELAQIRGRQLAQVVLKISKGPMQEITGRISSKMESIPLPLAPPLSHEEARKLASEKNIPLDIGFVCKKDRSSNWIRSLLKHHAEGIPFPTKTTDLVLTDYGFLSHGSVTAPELDELCGSDFVCRPEEVIVARIGPMPLVAMQGEVCGPIGMRIKDAFRTEIPIMVFGYLGTHNIYIPTRELVRLNVYQARVIQDQYGSPCGWAPEVEEEMVKGVVRLVRSVIEEETGK